MAVSNGEVSGWIFFLNERKVVHISGHRPENPVDQARTSGVLAVFAGKGYRLVDSRADRNPGEKRHLIDAQPKCVEHPIFHALYPHGGELSNIKIQKHPVLKHAKAQTGGQGGVPAVQSDGMDIFLEGEVGPRTLFFTGGERQ